MGCCVVVVALWLRLAWGVDACSACGGGVGLLVVLLRIGLLNNVSHSFGATTPARPAPTKSQRLQEIDNLHATGAMSEGEYTAERARIISSI